MDLSYRVCNMHNAYCIMYMHYTQYSTLYTVQYTVYIIQYTLYTILNTECLYTTHPLMSIADGCSKI